MLESLLGSDNAVAQAIVEPPVVLPVDVPLRREPVDLPGEAGGELGGVEAVDRADPALAGKQLLVVGVDVVAEDGDEARPGDDDALLRVPLPPRGGGGGNGGGRPDDGGEGDAPPAGGRGIGGFAEGVEGGDAEGRGMEGLHGGRERERGERMAVAMITMMKEKGGREEEEEGEGDL